MPRRSLRPQLNQIRTWVRQGRTDAWIAHQLEVTTQQIAAFKRENELVPDEAQPDGAPTTDFDDEIDLRAEDDALIAAELEAAQKVREQEEAEAAKKAAAKARARRAATADDEDEDDEDGDRAAVAADAAAVAAARRAPARSKGRSTTATRATGCGSTPPSRTTPSTPSTGPATVPSRSRSRKTRS